MQVSDNYSAMRTAVHSARRERLDGVGQHTSMIAFASNSQDVMYKIFAMLLCAISL